MGEDRVKDAFGRDGFALVPEAVFALKDKFCLTPPKSSTPKMDDVAEGPCLIDDVLNLIIRFSLSSHDEFGHVSCAFFLVSTQWLRCASRVREEVVLEMARNGDFPFRVGGDDAKKSANALAAFSYLIQHHFPLQKVYKVVPGGLSSDDPLNPKNFPRADSNVRKFLAYSVFFYNVLRRRDAFKKQGVNENVYPYIGPFAVRCHFTDFQQVWGGEDFVRFATRNFIDAFSWSLVEGRQQNDLTDEIVKKIVAQMVFLYRLQNLVKPAIQWITLQNANFWPREILAYFWNSLRALDREPSHLEDAVRSALSNEEIRAGIMGTYIPPGDFINLFLLS